MKLIWPEKIEERNRYRVLPTRNGVESGYYLLSIVQDGSELYAAIASVITNELFIERIEKAMKFNSFFSFEDLVKIDTEQEWKAILLFLTKEGVLS